MAASASGASGPPGFAATATMEAPANFVVSRVRVNRLLIYQEKQTRD